MGGKCCVSPLHKLWKLKLCILTSGFQKSGIMFSCSPSPHPSPLQPLCWARTGRLEGLCGQEGSALLGAPASAPPRPPSLPH